MFIPQDAKCQPFEFHFHYFGKKNDRLEIKYEQVI